MLAEGEQVRAYDREAMDKTSAIFPQIHYCRDPYEAAKDVDALLLLTEWEEFRQLDWERISDLMVRPTIIDGRNLLDPAAMMERGFDYHCFGRPIENAPASRILAHAPGVFPAVAHVPSAPS